MFAASAISASFVQMFDVAFAAADVLLARRQRQHVRALAVDVDGLADEAARACAA